MPNRRDSRLADAIESTSDCANEDTSNVTKLLKKNFCMITPEVLSNLINALGIPQQVMDATKKNNMKGRECIVVSNSSQRTHAELASIFSRVSNDFKSENSQSVVSHSEKPILSCSSLSENEPVASDPEAIELDETITKVLKSFKKKQNINKQKENVNPSAILGEYLNFISVFDSARGFPSDHKYVSENSNSCDELDSEISIASSNIQKKLDSQESRNLRKSSKATNLERTTPTSCIDTNSSRINYKQGNLNWRSTSSTSSKGKSNLSSDRCSKDLVSKCSNTVTKESTEDFFKTSTTKSSLYHNKHVNCNTRNNSATGSIKKDTNRTRDYNCDKQRIASNSLQEEDMYLDRDNRNCKRKSRVSKNFNKENKHRKKNGRCNRQHSVSSKSKKKENDNSFNKQSSVNTNSTGGSLTSDYKNRAKLTSVSHTSINVNNGIDNKVQTPVYQSFQRKVELKGSAEVRSNNRSVGNIKEKASNVRNLNGAFVKASKNDGFGSIDSSYLRRVSKDSSKGNHHNSSRNSSLSLNKKKVSVEFLNERKNVDHLSEVGNISSAKSVGARGPLITSKLKNMKTYQCSNGSCSSSDSSSESDSDGIDTDYETKSVIMNKSISRELESYKPSKKSTKLTRNSSCSSVSNNLNVNQMQALSTHNSKTNNSKYMIKSNREYKKSNYRNTETIKERSISQITPMVKSRNDLYTNTSKTCKRTSSQVLQPETTQLRYIIRRLSSNNFTDSFAISAAKKKSHKAKIHSRVVQNLKTKQYDNSIEYKDKTSLNSSGGKRMSTEKKTNSKGYTYRPSLENKTNDNMRNSKSITKSTIVQMSTTVTNMKTSSNDRNLNIKDLSVIKPFTDKNSQNSEENNKNTKINLKLSGKLVNEENGSKNNTQVVTITKTQPNSISEKIGKIFPSHGLQRNEFGLLIVQRENLTELRKLGSGGFGQVTLVQHNDSGNIYALKLACSKTKGRNAHINQIRVEQDILSKACHPFIIKVYAIGESDDGPFMVMEALPLGDLAQHLKKNKQFRNQQTMFFVAIVSLTLCYMHMRSTIHRDIKPENLLMTGEGYLKLSDFGSAKVLLPGVFAYTICGTPEYMAPEIVLKTGHKSSVDWWCVGVLIYELLVGIPPFSDESPGLVIRRMLLGLVHFPNFIGRQARSIIKSLLSVDHNDRLGSGFNIEPQKNVMRHPW